LTLVSTILAPPKRASRISYRSNDDAGANVICAQSDAERASTHNANVRKEINGKQIDFGRNDHAQEQLS